MPVTKVDKLSENGHAHRSLIVEQHWGEMTRAPLPTLDPLGAAILTSAIIDQQSGLVLCADSISSWLRNAAGFEFEERTELLALLATGRFASA